MNSTIKISTQLRVQYADLGELYEEAKLNENSPLMEKLIKSMASLAKQIQGQEVHEGETLNRKQLMSLANRIGITVGHSLKRHYPNDFRTNLVIDDIFQEITEMVSNDE